MKMVDEGKTHQFLMGLNDESFSSGRSQILARDPLPALDDIFNIVDQEENNQRVMTARDYSTEIAVAFAVREKNPVGERPTCAHCGKFGHDEAGCYELIGYPQNWSTRGRGRGVCGRSNRGGRGGQGRSRSSGRETTNAAWAQGESGPIVAAVAEAGPTRAETDPSATPCLTQEQIQRLLSLIESPKPNYEKLSGKHVWMFDSGASCHMTGDLSMIQEAEQVSPIAIGLPNRMQTFASKEGFVLLNNRIRLNNILFIPLLKCNPVSVAKLCKELNCCVTFFDDLCVLQGRTLRIPVGAGEQRGGVYYLKEGSLEKNQVNAVSSMNLWHKRLGHPSHGVLSLLPTDLGVISDETKDDVSETCYRAKQTRNRFPVSSNKVKCVFELIHCDI